MVCTTDCVSSITIPDLTDVCGDIIPREEIPSKLVIFRCDVTPPSGSSSAIATALEGLLSAGTMGVTGKLKNFVWGDPTTANTSFADCIPESPKITARTLTWDDYNAMDVDDNGDPYPYFDRDFYKTFCNNPGKYNFGWTTCEGLLYVCLNKAGTAFLTGTHYAFQTEDRSQTDKVYEVKKGTITFLGDPKSWAKPLIDLSAHSTLRGLY